MTNQICFTCSITNGSVTQAQGSSINPLGLTSVLTILKKRNLNAYNALETAKTFSATLEKEPTSDFTLRITYAAKKKLKLKLTHDQAQQVAGASFSAVSPPEEPSILMMIYAGILAFIAYLSSFFVEEAPVATETAPPSTGQPKDYCGIINGGPQRNDGNTCFINAAFQMIMNCDETFLKALVLAYANKGLDQPFLRAVKAYREGKMDEIDLTPLRQLLLSNKGRYEQGDAYEVILALLLPLNQTADDSLFFPQIIERKFVPFDANADQQKILADRVNETKAKHGDNWRESYPVLPANGSVQALEPHTYCFPITLESGETDGSTLIHQMFQEMPRNDQNNTNSATGYFADEEAKQKGEVSFYYPTTIKTVLPKLPERFMIDLKRFQVNQLGMRTKIATPIHMPEEVTLSGQKYRLKSIVVHTGSVQFGHYYAYLRKKSGWVNANDQSVTPTQNIQDGLNNGYLYWYEKV